MRVIGWDTETHLFGDCPCGQHHTLAPPLVCLTLAGGSDTEPPPTGQVTLGENGNWSALLSADDAIEGFFWALEQSDALVAHNAAYDLGVLDAHSGGALVDFFLDLLEEGRLRDTSVREKLIAIADGNFDFDSRIRERTSFSLARLVYVYFRVDISESKSEGSWRMRYHELDGVPLDRWPEAAKNYALEDAVWARAVFLAQCGDRAYPEGPVVVGNDVVDELPQTAAAWALHLIALHGPRTDARAVAQFKRTVEREVSESEAAAAVAGFLRINKCKFCEGTGLSGDVPHLRLCTACGGQVDPAFKQAKHLGRLRALIDHDYGGNAPKTEKGATKTDVDTLMGSTNALLKAYAEGSASSKLLGTYLPVLERGTEHRIASSPNVLVSSGRTSWREPNLQNPPRKGGFRECFVPEPGNVYCSIDYSTLELCTLAQVNLHFFGYSRMADALNAGRDLHLDFAAQMLGITYDEALERHKAKDPVLKERRQNAKIANFGFPGGLGVQALVEYAAGFGITLSFNEADNLKRAWLEAWPEMNDYFKMLSMASQVAPDGRFRIRQVGSNRLRGDCHYTSAANSYFQGLAADGAKAAMWALTRAMYSGDQNSPLYGVRCWAFIHDEFLFEGPEATAHLWAPKAARIMCEEMARYVPSVPIKAEPALMRRWYKDAEPVYDEAGKLTIWEPKEGK